VVIHKSDFCNVDNPALSTKRVDNPRFLYAERIYNRIFRRRSTGCDFSCKVKTCMQKKGMWITFIVWITLKKDKKRRGVNVRF
jgi:hypothetical protein